MSAPQESFQHDVAVWTVGQLRAALDGVPDEARVRVFLAEEPGGDTADEQVVYGAAHEDRIWYPDGQAYEPARRPEDGWFTISAEFPSGEYYRDPR